MKLKKLTKATDKAAIVVGTFIGTAMSPVMVYAGDNEVLGQMNKLKVFVFGIVGAIGAVTLGKGIMSMGTAISQRDTSGMATAAAEIAGGIIMVGATGIMTYMGVKGF